MVVFRSEGLVFSKGTFHLGEPLANSLDRIRERLGENTDDLRRAVLLKLFDRLYAQKFKDLPRVVIFFEEHVELFFLGHEWATK